MLAFFHSHWTLSMYDTAGARSAAMRRRRAKLSEKRDDVSWNRSMHWSMNGARSGWNTGIGWTLTSTLWSESSPIAACNQPKITPALEGCHMTQTHTAFTDMGHKMGKTDHGARNRPRVGGGNKLSYALVAIRMEAKPLCHFQEILREETESHVECSLSQKELTITQNNQLMNEKGASEKYYFWQ